jgi:hypothetical protein
VPLSNVCVFLRDKEAVFEIKVLTMNGTNDQLDSYVNSMKEKEDKRDLQEKQCNCSNA